MLPGFRDHPFDRNENSITADSFNEIRVSPVDEHAAQNNSEWKLLIEAKDVLVQVGLLDMWIHCVLLTGNIFQCASNPLVLKILFVVIGKKAPGSMSVIVSCVKSFIVPSVVCSKNGFPITRQVPGKPDAGSYGTGFKNGIARYNPTVDIDSNAGINRESVGNSPGILSEE